MPEQQEDLWRQFSLRDRDPNPGRAIALSIKKSTADIERLREKTVARLERLGVAAVDCGEDEIGLQVEIGHQDIDLDQFRTLASFLSGLNSAEDYIKGLNINEINTIPDLCNHLTAAYLTNLTQETLPEVFEFVEFAIPQLLKEIRTAQRMGHLTLSDEDEQELKRFEERVRRMADQLGNNSRLVVLSS
ncbi:hypothetical protein ACFL2V_16780 [Pseudomonadota bacterium]